MIWYKVYHDLWHNKRRTLLAVLSIAAGVFAIGAFFGIANQLLSTMDARHRAGVPSHIMMNLQGLIDAEIVDALTRIDGVADIEPGNQIGIRYKLHPAEDWESGVMIMRDDYTAQTYNLLQLRAGAWPERNDIGIERQSSAYFGLSLGDTVIFDLQGADRPLPLSGRIRHPFVIPPNWGGPAYFFSDPAGLERFGVPAGWFNQLHVRVEPYSDDLAKSVGSEIKERLAREGIGTGFTVYQDPVEHWGRRNVEGASFVLQILAVVSLMLSAVLVLNTLTALITEQTNQIGVIKAVGGSTWTVLKLYLVEVFVYGVLALLLALPLGMVVAFFGTRYMLTIFNIDYNTFQFSPRAVLLQVLSALLVPLIAALWPILKGALMSVRQAIASYGLGADFGSSRLDQAIEWLGSRFLPTIYAAALGNMFRRKGRLALTQIVLITAGTLFLMVMTINKSMTLTLDRDMDRREFDIRIAFQERHRLDQLERIAHTLPEIVETQGWLAQTAIVLRQGERLNSAGVGAEIIGLPIGREMYVPIITAGRWLRPEDDNAVVISTDTAEDHDFQIGDWVTLDLGELGDAEWRIVGISESTYDDGFQPDPIYAPLKTLHRYSKVPNRSNRLMAQIDSPAVSVENQVAEALKMRYEDENLDTDIFVTGTTAEDRAYAKTQFDVLIGFLFMLAMIVAVVGGIGLMGTLSISVVERTREIGVMRATGASSRSIMSMFTMEGVLQGLISWAGAVPLSYLIAQPVARRFGQITLHVDLAYSYDFWAMLWWLIAILLIGVVASVLPARSAAQISVRQSLTYG